MKVKSVMSAIFLLSEKLLMQTLKNKLDNVKCHLQLNSSFGKRILTFYGTKGYSRYFIYMDNGLLLMDMIRFRMVKK